MTCREVTEFLSEYLSGELPSAQRAAFDAHLRECPECVTYLQSYKETVKLGKGVFRHPDEPVPDDVPEEFVQAILAARKQHER
jgi:anti-sigma factor RsiW